MFEVARSSLSAAVAKPAVDRLQLSQLGMARRLLNPQLYELHDDLPENKESSADEVSEPLTSLDDPTMDDPPGETELIGHSASDHGETWSECVTELPSSTSESMPVHDTEKTCSSAENQRNDGQEDERSESHSDIKSSNFSDDYPQHSEPDSEVTTSSEASPPPTVNNVPAVTPTETIPPCNMVSTPDAVVKTTVAVSTCAATSKPATKSASKTTSTTACTTLSTSTTSSCKSERPRASPCRAALTKHQSQPVANGKESKVPSCKAASSATKQSTLSNAAAAKLLVDMVGRSKSSSSAAGVGQCKPAQCADRVLAADGNTISSTDGGSCSLEKMPRGTAAAGGATDGRKDGKFCECWHCEFFGHMSVSG